MLKNVESGIGCPQSFCTFVKIYAKVQFFRKANYYCRHYMTQTRKKRVTLQDKTFEISIPYQSITEAVAKVAERINNDYADSQPPLFVGVLNGSFMFMAELMQRIEIPCELSFVKVASYSGTQSTGKVHNLIGLKESLEGRQVIIVEDIVDTGRSIAHTWQLLEELKPESIEVATLLFKPESYNEHYSIKYRAIEIPNDFIVGFGLDYNELGRNLRDIYSIVDE